jgi:hypothetical protein
MSFWGRFRGLAARPRPASPHGLGGLPKPFFPCAFRAKCYDQIVMTIFFALFDTAIGRCAIAWSARGVVGVQLPEADEAKTRSRVLQRFPGAWQAVPPPEMACVRDALAGLLRGLPGGLSFVRLDMDALMAASRRWRAPLGRPAPWGKLLHGIRSHSLCRAIALSRLAAGSAVSRRMAASR